jgi:putative ABC transport system permease protein
MSGTGDIPRPSYDAHTGVSALSGRLRRSFILGVKSLWLHRLRSLLTVLGIVFGVCSVIAMLAIGEGASFEAREQIRQLGSSNIIVRSVKPPEETSGQTQQRSMVVEYGLTYDDIDRIEATIPGVRILVPARIIRKNVWVGGKRVDCDIYGTMPWHPEITNRTITRGRYFDRLELMDRKNVCVIEERMAAELFPIDDPVGKTVRVEESYFRVIGIMAPKSAIGSQTTAEKAINGGGGAQGAPNAMYIPLTAARHRFGETIMKRTTGSFSAEKVELHEAVVMVANEEDVIETSLIVGDILQAYHKKNDYEIVVPLELLRQAERTKRIFNIVLGSVAAISLLVGGIGIMNIMLATVTERTREIGIRRALGAKKRDVVFQFLIETVLLSGAGGVIGVALGLAIPFLISYFADMRTIVVLWSPVAAFGISGLVGVVFGIYPAMRAANMDPVEALRHE